MFFFELICRQQMRALKIGKNLLRIKWRLWIAYRKPNYRKRLPIVSCAPETKLVFWPKKALNSAHSLTIAVAKSFDPPLRRQLPKNLWKTLKLKAGRVMGTQHERNSTPIARCTNRQESAVRHKLREARNEKSRKKWGYGQKWASAARAWASIIFRRPNDTGGGVMISTPEQLFPGLLLLFIGERARPFYRPSQGFELRDCEEEGRPCLRRSVCHIRV